MRAFWLTLLATGLLLVTIDAYESSKAGSTKLVSPCEDGTGMPTPTPKPPKLN